MAMKLREGLYWTGVLDPQLRVFDVIMHTEFGTTYNSYVLKGSEKTALVETAKEKFFEEYLEQVRQVVDPSEIDYLIVDHTEPDHAGSIARFLDLNPNAKVVGTATAIGFLKHILNRDFYSIAVEDGDTLSLGDRTLTFFSLPNLHWPDSMYTYVEGEGILFTCDSFGSHYSHEGILRSTVTDTQGYLRATKYYFDNILGPFAHPYLTNALDRVEKLPLSLICPGHGPVLDSHIPEILELYRQWTAQPQPREKKLVVIPYVSAYGYTARLAQQIAQGIRDSGEIEVQLFDMVEADKGEVLSLMGQADGILLGTPTILGEALAPIWELTLSLFAPVHGGKLAAAFGSYGWSGEGVPHLIQRLEQLNMRVLEGFRVRFSPSSDQLLDAYEYGYHFGCVLQDREDPRKQEKKAVKKMVRCLVCGAVFEEGTKICPVCGVGPENFVPEEVAQTSFSKDTTEIFLILGSGAAAVYAAQAIRERNKTASIVMASRDSRLPYNRPMLTKSMFAGLDEEQLAIFRQDWYDQHEIYRIEGKEVVGIDPQKREVTMSDGSRFSYDQCIYALGSHSFIPPFPGREQEGVLSIRTVEDVERTAKLIEDTKEAVVIGGGVLGLEAAWQLRREGCKVTVLETATRLLAGKVDESMSGMLQEAGEAVGVTILTGIQVEQILGDGKVTGVRLSDGREIPAGLVLVSCGVRANTEVAAKAGVQIGRSVVVDDQMRTNVPHIFACGDCAEYQGVNLALWSQAVEMGKVAGAVAAGDDSVRYKAEMPALHMEALETALYCVGDNGSDPTQKYKTMEIKDTVRRRMEKYYFLHNQLVGAALLGDTSKLAWVTQAVAERRPFGEMF